MFEHSVEPDTRSVIAVMQGTAKEGTFIGFHLGNCNYCGRKIEFDDDGYAWHLDED